MEHEKKPGYTIREMRLQDGEAVHNLLMQLHQDTYKNEELGITREKLSERFERRTPDEREERLRERIASDNNQAYVATDESDKIIGMVAPRIEEDGARRLGALYIKTEWHGSGLANELMQKAIDWHGSNNDIELHVVAYNERAKAFYRKWGFQEVNGSDALFDGMIPEVKMIRKGEKHHEV